MSLSKFEHVKISAISCVVPEKCINIDDEISFYKNDEKLLARNKKILGLGTRYVIEPGTTTSDLCKEAADILIKDNKIDKNSIESLIVVTTSHDYAYPATACVLHGALELNENCTCYDIAGLACSGYVHALFQAYALIESGAVKNCLLLCGDISSTHSDVRNRNVNMLFGDAGTATFIEYSKEKNEAFFYTGTRGNGWDKIIAPATGYALPVRKDISELEIINEQGDVWHLWEDIMGGFEVFKFTMDIAPLSIEKLLEYSGKTIDDIDFFAFHQANGQIVNNIARSARLPKDKYSIETFRKYANTSTASVITVLCDILFEKAVGEVMLVTFGVGLSWGSCSLNMKSVKNSGISFYKAKEKMTREEQINYWINYFKNGET